MTMTTTEQEFLRELDKKPWTAAAEPPRIATYRRALFAMIIAAVVCGAGACKEGRSMITIPCRTCIMRGTALSGLPAVDRDAIVQDAYSLINNAIWNQADIVFLGCCQEIPVIDDPVPTLHAEGELAFGNTHILPSSEMLNAYQACADAWAAKTSITGSQTGFTEGPVVIIARDITTNLGSPVPDIGITNPRPTSTNVCQSPRNLTAADVAGRFSIVPEPAMFGPRINQHMVGNMPQSLAHELGHQLLLEHGNGLDDDGNGTMPPAPGPRLFDSRCDPAESGGSETHSGANSLMGAWFGQTNLTPLQIELARDAARVWPGHTGN